MQEIHEGRGETLSANGGREATIPCDYAMGNHGDNDGVNGDDTSGNNKLNIRR